MRTPKTLKALLLSALGASASATAVYFQNVEGTDATQTVDVYVDGRLLFQGAAPGSFTLAASEVSGGEHQVEVTPTGQAPGPQDLMNTTVTLPQNGTYTLNYGESTGSTGVDEPTLGLTTGIHAAQE